MIGIPVITLFLLVLYGILIAYYHKGWKKQPVSDAPEAFHPRTAISVLIPVRNESANIDALIESLRKLDYPESLREFIILDDFSTDDTAAKLAGACLPGLRVIPLASIFPEGADAAPKKRALQWGVAQATGDLIVTTDGDCLFHQGWLRQLAWQYSGTSMASTEGTVCVAGPVMVVPGNSVLGVFQSLDFSSLQGITAAAAALGFHSMGNGANLAFSKTAFVAVGGYEKINQIASGDDMLLMAKFAEQYPDGMQYAKSRKAIVQTVAERSWQLFFRQRIRWASKARFYRERKLFSVLLLVYSVNLMLVVHLLWAPFSLTATYWLAGCWALKVLVEWPFQWSVSRFFDNTRLMIWFPLVQPLHWIYTVIAGTFSQFGSYQWKGRKLR
ncbi:glycosyltransferase [Flavihumibacter petaseus]|uniref:Putative glycosyltransferase n=1 Tax=Flavihumibacter petaseus NBRC 106054 TaxID=1220578 RepID=A0A0E9MXL6_9BACT|nr:glycosyltransferase [Flavihumibacter petaseus]GAO42171.1 putative glycosyltransferase [Flavihumibacter petaseus NBRC 106054]